jgi:cytidylate kinase
MAAWLIRVTAKQREHIDAYLVAQAVIAYARQLWEREKAEKREAGNKTGSREASP